MGNLKQAGFTIIETTLFLGISSFLIVTLIAGTGNSVNVQRYNDAVQTLKSTIQRQYGDLSSVQNSRDDNWSCGTNAAPIQTGTIKQNRGQSNCLLLGKYVRLEDDKIDIYTVTGYQKANTSLTDDVSLLKANYQLNISADTIESSTLEWGTKISNPKVMNNAPNPLPQNPRKVGILVVRSPDSGQIYTFTNSDNNVPAKAGVGSVSLANMLVTGDSIPGQGQRVLCVNSGGLQANDGQAIVISQFATSASSVEMQTNDYMAKSGSGIRC
jgi:type II secretory pathway pseudopilin PulG